jgi:hypothetical protein
LILYIVTVIIYLVWIAIVHKDMNELEGSYEISPRGALARILIPIYNLWGLGNTYNTLGNYFQERYTIVQLGKRITNLVPMLYLIVFGGNALDRYVKINQYNVSDKVILFIEIFKLLGVIIYLVIAKSVYIGLVRLAAEKNQVTEEPRENHEILEPWWDDDIP